jgi:hypothetical protein
MTLALNDIDSQSKVNKLSFNCYLLFIYGYLQKYQIRSCFYNYLDHQDQINNEFSVISDNLIMFLTGLIGTRQHSWQQDKSMTLFGSWSWL